MENTDTEVYKSVSKRVKHIKGFYFHLFCYAVVIITLLIINLATSPYYLWFLWPALGWGIGVALHGIGVFNVLPFFGHDWEQRKIQELVEKENGKQWR
ncbi:2TM domain-containing protein [Flavobacterium zepuense]|uniref:2TM domain-containing protein n=1 Tax=Flavobacterium zepuense TaxID=2593302 RepID=A0A552UXW5_9FLAO|nr:2TM domain-containing protein [Flavobacterium zepuense]TRW23058.1 2TM domain-containing protein [Flavobacterium zepuense]